MSSPYKALFLISICILSVLNVKSNTLDSLRVDKIKGKKFIIHRVDPKETLYAISKRYNSSIDEIYKYNPHIEAGLQMYDELKIPYDKKKSTETSPSTVVESTVDAKYSIVKQGQTLFALSKQTGVSVHSLKAINQLNSNAIGIGDTIYWNYPNNTVENINPIRTGISSDTDVKAIFHTVQPGETLFYISKKYTVSIDELVQSNNLESYNLEIDKKLIIPQDTKVINSVEETIPAVNPKDEIKPIVIDSTEIIKAIALREKRKTDTVFVKTDNHAIKTKIEETNGDNIVIQEGFALEINDTDHTTKLLALHKTAPLGSLVSITNQMNGKTIQVRVVGELLDSPLNKNVVVRLSNSAFKTLGALDFKIPITSKYVQ